jgi:hypothetical protein
MGHSLGLSDSYYRATELELLDDYLKVQHYLIINDENRLRKKVEDLTQKDKNRQYLIDKNQNEKDDEIQQMKKEINIMKQGQKELLELLKNPTQFLAILNKD